MTCRLAADPALSERYGPLLFWQYVPHIHIFQVSLMHLQRESVGYHAHMLCMVVAAAIMYKAHI
jgi:hypothetical protein